MQPPPPTDTTCAPPTPCSSGQTPSILRPLSAPLREGLGSVRVSSSTKCERCPQALPCLGLPPASQICPELLLLNGNSVCLTLRLTPTARCSWFGFCSERNVFARRRRSACQHRVWRGPAFTGAPAQHRTGHHGDSRTETGVRDETDPGTSERTQNAVRSCHQLLKGPRAFKFPRREPSRAHRLHH